MLNRPARASSRRARQPEVIAAASEALGEIAAGALRIAGAEARLEQRVVEDVALRAGSPELDDPGTQRLDPLDRAAVVTGREGVDALEQRQQHVAHQSGPVLRHAASHGV